jgi:hypothetical protein
MASTKRIIRNVLVEVLQSAGATYDERIKAARTLMKLLGLANPGNPRGSHAAKKTVQGAEPEDRLARLLSGTTK